MSRVLFISRWANLQRPPMGEADNRRTESAEPVHRLPYRRSQGSIAEELPSTNHDQWKPERQDDGNQTRMVEAPEHRAHWIGSLRLVDETGQKQSSRRSIHEASHMLDEGHAAARANTSASGRPTWPAPPMMQT